jgi:hypothetical protein
MTYTFKLARRLAVSRNFPMLPALLLFAACSGDATAPDPANPSAPGLTPVAVRIKPSTVTLETNQLIQFLAQSHTSAGDPVAAAVTWRTTGGTILPDGRFFAAVIGTFKVIVRNRVPTGVQADTSTVRVVRRQLGLTAIVVTPATATLKSGAEQTFTAMGRRRRTGTLVPVGVNWSVSGGGSIDAGGTYVAGDTGGTYQVIAANTAGTLADTSTITIDAPPPPAPPPPAPPPPPPPPPAPVVSQVTLVPATATLVTGTTRQFQAYGRTTAGDSVAVSVVFAAPNGGTVSQQGLYTAGPTAGTFRVVASLGALADTSVVTVRSALGSGTPTGIPFGPFGLWTSITGTPSVGVAPFTASIDYTDANLIVPRITAARAAKRKLLLMMTDNGHAPYITAGQFDLVKWKAAMDIYKTAEIKAAVEAGVADGTVLGNSLLDEPNHTDWGGVITKATLDEMAAYSKSIFPTMPAGVVAPYWWRATERYKVVDFIVAQTWKTTLTPAAFRDAAVAAANQNGVAVALSLNLFGGPPVPGCALTQWGTCPMTAAEIRDWGQVVGVAGCALLMWKYDATFMSTPENAQAFRDVGDLLAKTASRPCKRP